VFSDHILYVVKLYYIRNTYSSTVNKYQVLNVDGPSFTSSQVISILNV